MEKTTSIPVVTIQVSGAVQGVGFRPFVYREACRLHLHGWVRNTNAGAEIRVSGSTRQLDDFVDTLRTRAPFPIHVADIRITPEQEPLEVHGFHIRDSDRDGLVHATALPDMATCPDCLRDIRDPSNRRHRYPFTNCTACGPRYSILLDFPYDRERTTMRAFQQCPACRREFDDPTDRRFHAQPNACPVCGPQLSLWDRHGRAVAQRDHALREAVQHIIAGGIVAVKGLGGFHLMCDATNHATIAELRRRKHREEKPFAVMASTIDMAESLADISPTERAWLTSAQAPIVLLRKKTSALADNVAPRNRSIGLLLPYTPLHHLLTQDAGIPLIATSGNLSDEPICTDEHEALDRLQDVADYFLVHDRPIAQPVDDSVMRVVMDEPLMLRCARGFAPVVLDVPPVNGRPDALGVGPHMKATLALGHGCHLVVSPHVGDLETVPAWQAYERNLSVLENLYQVQPTVIACDGHPHYASTRYAERRTIHPIPVQHHHAHVLAVMAEFQLTGPVLGIAWDGTGYGDDGTIWGGEFLRVDQDGYQRMNHLRTFPLPGGDAAAREPRRSALGVLYELGIRDADVYPLTPGRQIAPTRFTTREQKLLSTTIEKNITTIKTSSAGRLFDAVASILGICHVSSYEGQAAMLLQAEAEMMVHDDSAYPIDATPNTAALDWATVIRGVLHDRDAGIATPIIAARFHQSMVNLMRIVALKTPDIPIVLCGGCFQNAWLLEHAVNQLQQLGRKVYWPHRLPPNDGAIAAGQVMAAYGRSPR